MSEAASSAAPAPSAPAQQATITSLPPIPKPKPAADPGPSTQRGPDGKFASTKEPEKKPAPAADDDPEYEIDGVRMKRSQLKSELGRARSASKLLTEAKREKEEAAKLRSEQDERKKKYREDPEAFFADLGIEDAEERAKWASRYLYDKHIKPSEMTAEQRAIAERDARIAAYEAKEKEAASAKEKAEMERVSEDEGKKLRSQIGAILKAGGLPQRPLAVKRVAERIAAYEEQGIDVPVEDAARLVRDELAADTADLLGSASMDDLAALWGPEKSSAITKRLLTEGGIDGLRARMAPADFRAVAMMFAEWGASQIRGGAKAAPRAASPAPAPSTDKFITPQDFMQMRRK